MYGEERSVHPDACVASRLLSLWWRRVTHQACGGCQRRSDVLRRSNVIVCTNRTGLGVRNSRLASRYHLLQRPAFIPVFQPLPALRQAPADMHSRQSLPEYVPACARSTLRCPHGSMVANRNDVATRPSMPSGCTSPKTSTPTVCGQTAPQRCLYRYMMWWPSHWQATLSDSETGLCSAIAQVLLVPNCVTLVSGCVIDSIYPSSNALGFHRTGR